MKKTLVVSIFGIAACLLMAFVLFAKKNITPAPVQRPASAWKLEKSKAWITGRVALDSGYAKSVTLTAPTLSLSGMFHTELAYLNESDGTFTLEAEIYGPQRERLIYSGNGIPVYLEPGDTLHVEFASSDFMKNSDGKFSSVRYSGSNAAVNADLLAFAVHRGNTSYDPFREGKTAEDFRAGTDALYRTYRDQLQAFTVKRQCDPKFFDLADREITTAKQLYTWYAIEVSGGGPLPAKEAPALFAGSESSLDDRNFTFLMPYLYYLDQLGQVDIWGADTVGKPETEKIQVLRNNFDTLLARYPAGLSRDAFVAGLRCNGITNTKRSAMLCRTSIPLRTVISKARSCAKRGRKLSLLTWLPPRRNGMCTNSNCVRPNSLSPICSHRTATAVRCCM